jgi:hypothetical protein
MLVYPWKAEPFAWAMLAGFSTFFLVSLCTKPEDKAAMEVFFDKMRKSSGSEDIIGFLLSWLFVGTLILIVWGIMQIG